MKLTNETKKVISSLFLISFITNSIFADAELIARFEFNRNLDDKYLMANGSEDEPHLEFRRETPKGRMGYSIEFTDHQEYLSCFKLPSSLIEEEGSLSFWVNKKEPINKKKLEYLFYAPDLYSGIYIGFNEEIYEGIVINLAGEKWSYYDVVPFGKWTHVALTWSDDGIATLYINGKKQEDVIEFDASSLHVIDKIRIGNFSGNNNAKDKLKVNQFTGYLYDLNFYEGVLSKNQIGKLFNRR
jgi:hypothetical protein